MPKIARVYFHFRYEKKKRSKASQSLKDHQQLSENEYRSI